MIEGRLLEHMECIGNESQGANGVAYKRKMNTTRQCLSILYDSSKLEEDMKSRSRTDCKLHEEKNDIENKKELDLS